MHSLSGTWKVICGLRPLARNPGARAHQHWWGGGHGSSLVNWVTIGLQRPVEHSPCLLYSQDITDEIDHPPELTSEGFSSLRYTIRPLHIEYEFTPLHMSESGILGHNHKGSILNIMFQVCD